MAMKQSPSEGLSSGNSEDRPHSVRFYEAAYLFSKVVSYGIKQTEKNFLETKNYKTTKEFYDSYRIKAYFFTVITENLIKALWAFENFEEKPECTHNILKLWSELSEKLKEEVKEVYSECKIWTREDEKEMATFEETLEWNSETIKDGKYDLPFSPNFNGKSIPCGIKHTKTGGGLIGNAAGVPDFSQQLLEFVKNYINSEARRKNL